MSFGGEIPNRSKQNPVIEAQFDILYSAIKNAKKDAESDKGYVLDHLEHINTEIGRLRAILA